ncbi:16S rRNA (guanine(527)-N(7))-methyltransferase RsmG [Tateyamaria sp. SN3-11]|uniref:16S rRNA (guanine(527)-N(7))-methyltransferase RsmG n=1 Tax=Tateyamaria sp. SN3-11 TaxID=3092147 RepID=UPI0039E8DC83
MDKLAHYAELLRKWTVRINLIAKSTLDDVEHRHIWDSAQIYTGFEGVSADLGSGGGLPGVVIAVLAQGEGRQLDLTLIESDQRKATFLRTCARELDLPISVVAKRVEEVASIGAAMITARALADLNLLLGFAHPHLAPHGQCVFMKGAKWREEIARAQENWRFSYEATPSKTDAQAAILTIKDIERV